MINILVDEAYAFDMLAIAELKAEYAPTLQNCMNVGILLGQLHEQVGAELTATIHGSEPYQMLLEANRKAFLLIDRIVADEQIGAEQVHNANMERYHWKRKIQSLFFGNDLNEQKTV